jgi:hypothetical protein
VLKRFPLSRHAGIHLFAKITALARKRFALFHPIKLRLPLELSHSALDMASPAILGKRVNCGASAGKARAKQEGEARHAGRALQF